MELPIFDERFKSNPHTLYNQLRDEGKPITRVNLPTGVEAWLVTGYSTACQLLNDPRLSKDSQYAGSNWHTTHPTSYRGKSHPVFRHLLTIDPPEHTRLRGMLARELSPQRVEQLRPRIQQIATKLLDGIASIGHADLIEAFALPLPLRVICEILGVPTTDEHLFRRWSTILVTANLEEQELIPVAANELRHYLITLACIKRCEPDESLFCRLVAAHDAEELSEEELVSMGFLLLVAGHETTVNLIGNGVLALLSEPIYWRKLCNESRCLQNTIEELLRFSSPLDVATPRFATSEIQISGVCICPGDVVFVGLAAANRDPTMFERADQLDLNRVSSMPHLAFGHGIHYCLGAGLARLEAEIAFTVLTQYFPDMKLAVDPTELSWRVGLIMRGLRQLPVQLHPQ